MKNGSNTFPHSLRYREQVRTHSWDHDGVKSDNPFETTIIWDGVTDSARRNTLKNVLFGCDDGVGNGQDALVSHKLLKPGGKQTDRQSCGWLRYPPAS